MEIQLQDLVDKIKHDGVDSAKQQAASIIADAEKRAKGIIAAAQAEADDVLKKAEAASERFTKSSEEAVKLASRNALIAFQESITKEVDALIKAEVNAAYTTDILKELIPAAVNGWIKVRDTDDISVILSVEDAKKLESSLLAAFKKQVEKGIEVTSDARLSGGFRIGVKDGSAYYDFSAETVANLFSAYVSSRAALLLKAAAKEL